MLARSRRGPTSFLPRPSSPSQPRRYLLRLPQQTASFVARDLPIVSQAAFRAQLGAVIGAVGAVAVFGTAKQHGSAPNARTESHASPSRRKGCWVTRVERSPVRNAHAILIHRPLPAHEAGTRMGVVAACSHATRAPIAG
jgi:hypothetical protein